MPPNAVPELLQAMSFPDLNSSPTDTYTWISTTDSNAAGNNSTGLFDGFDEPVLNGTLAGKCRKTNISIEPDS